MSPLKLPLAGVGQTIVAIWIIFSVAFIANSLWQNFQQKSIVEAYDIGYNTAKLEDVTQLAAEAEKCEPFEVRLGGNNKIQLQKVGC